MTNALIEREILEGIARRSTCDGDGNGADEETFDRGIDLFVVADRGGRVTVANAAWTRVLGWSRKELASRSLLDLAHPDDLDATLALWPLMADGGVAHIENRYRCADGGYRRLQWSAFQSGDSIFGAAKDITERRAAELIASARERRAQAVLDALPDGVTLMDSAGRITDVNRRFCTMVGLDAAVIIGAVPPYAWWPEEDAGELSWMLGAAMGHGRLRAKATFQRASGERFPTTIDVEGHPIGGGEPGLLCVSRDDSERVVERRRVTVQDVTPGDGADAARTHSLWQGTLDALDDRVAVLDDQGIIVGVNEAWTQFAEANGARDADVGADYLGACERAASGTSEDVAGDLRALLAGEVERVDCEYPCHSPTERRWFAMSARRFDGAAGRFALIQHADVTDRKLGKLAAQADRDRLLEAQRVAALGAWELDVRTNLIEVSDQFPDALGGARAGGVPVASLLERVWEPDRELLEGAIADAAATDGYVDVEWRFGPADDLHWAVTRAFAVRDPDGVVTHIRGITQDITIGRRAEQEILTQADLLNSVDASILATNADGIVTHANSGFERIYGFTTDEVVGRPLEELRGKLGHRVTGPLQSLTEPISRELDMHRRDGTPLSVYLRRQPIRDRNGVAVGAVNLTVDITARVEAERSLRSARDFLDAVTDAMADGVITLDPQNRVRYMNVAAERMLGWAREELLGQTIEAVIGMALPTDARTIRVEDGEFTRGDGTRLPVSFTASPFEAESGERGSVVVFRDITARKAEEERLLQQVADMTSVNAIRDALAQDRLVLHAQPIIDIATGETVQEELLVRMLDEDGNLISPGAFLPVAERTGLIGQIDRWVVREALALAADGRAVELNLSAHSIGDPDMLTFFETALWESGADPCLVVVELTETAVVGHPEAAERFVRRVRELGCGFALDDFGTGYGGFTYLKRLPVDYLKIDIDFVRNLPNDPAGRTVIEAVVNLARGFGQKTVAEGVEDDETLDLLRELGVDYAQGYGIARPAPIV